MGNLTLAFGFLIFGSVVIFLGVMMRLGKLRGLYANQSLPVFAQREVTTISIPLGLAFLTIGLMVMRPDLQGWLTYPLLALFGSYVVLGIWQPWWLKPAWLRWLENNYGHVLEEMFAEAHAMGRRNWAEQVNTQEGLERWADSVAQKNGWQRRRS